jgi:translocator protein
VAVAGLGALMADLGGWYAGLRKPAWQPPDILFGPAWTLIFGFCTLSGYLAWRNACDRSGREWIIALFALNGFLNVLWSALFFRLKRPDWALAEVGLLWLSIVLLIVVLARYSKWASLLLVPYLAWVSFAAILNLAIVRLNSPFT